MEHLEIIKWALAHGFRQTGVNAYLAFHDSVQYQMVLKSDKFICQKIFAKNVKPENCSNMTYDGLHIDEYGMLQGAGIAESMARAMFYNDKPAPVWFSDAYLDHVHDDMFPRWAAIASGVRLW